MLLIWGLAMVMLIFIRDFPHPPKAPARATEIGRMLNGLLKNLPKD